jgi:hypothetical protein
MAVRVLRETSCALDPLLQVPWIWGQPQHHLPTAGMELVLAVCWCCSLSGMGMHQILVVAC